MPKKATDADLIDLEEVSLEPSLVQGERTPIFEGAKVVYLGAHDHMAVPLKGSVVEHRTGEGAEAVTSKVVRPLFGMSYYDFSHLDTHGRRIEGEAHRMADNHPNQSVRDRRFQKVENAEHLYWFAQRPREFRIVASRPVMDALEQYIKRRELARKGQRRMVDEMAAA